MGELCKCCLPTFLQHPECLGVFRLHVGCGIVSRDAQGAQSLVDAVYPRPDLVQLFAGLLQPLAHLLPGNLALFAKVFPTPDELVQLRWVLSLCQHAIHGTADSNRRVDSHLLHGVEAFGQPVEHRHVVCEAFGHLAQRRRNVTTKQLYRRSSEGLVCFCQELRAGVGFFQPLQVAIPHDGEILGIELGNSLSEVLPDCLGGGAALSCHLSHRLRQLLGGHLNHRQSYSALLGQVLHGLDDLLVGCRYGHGSLGAIDGRQLDYFSRGLSAVCHLPLGVHHTSSRIRMGLLNPSRRFGVGSDRCIRGGDRCRLEAHGLFAGGVERLLGAVLQLKGELLQLTRQVSKSNNAEAKRHSREEALRHAKGELKRDFDALDAVIKHAQQDAQTLHGSGEEANLLRRFLHSDEPGDYPQDAIQ